MTVSAGGNRKNLLLLDSPKCIRCSHLIKFNDGEKAAQTLRRFKCTAKNGNKNCPAQTERVVVGAPIEEWANKLLECQIRGNAKKDLEIRQDLVKKFHPVVQSLIMQRLNQLLAER